MTFNQALQLWDRQEALRLLSHVTGYTTTEIILNAENELTEPSRYMELIEKRKNHVPLQYIIGQWEFMGLCFNTDKRALIPRPETEILAETVIKAIHGKSKKVLDLCTGSGCLAVTIAKLADVKDIVAVDINDGALSLAKENAELHDIANKINFITSDLFNSLENEIFDIIVSNPPYIPATEIMGLQPEVRDYEPHLALNGGTDGLDFYRRLIPDSFKYLNPGGFLFLETGTAWQEVLHIITQTGFKNIEKTPDYSGFIRVLKGEKPNV
jgi:release factor glutamine methyltransferase